MELGLLIFMAGVGITAGASIIETVLSAGPTLFICGVIVTITPVVMGYLFGSKVLRLNPVLLLGGITGALTSGASLSIVKNQAKSAVPALGYTGSYAFANVLLTIAGSIIVAL
jgi:putative transport protein